MDREPQTGKQSWDELGWDCCYKRVNMLMIQYHSTALILCEMKRNLALFFTTLNVALFWYVFVN